MLRVGVGVIHDDNILKNITKNMRDDQFDFVFVLNKLKGLRRRGTSPSTKNHNFRPIVAVLGTFRHMVCSSNGCSPTV